MAFNDPHPKDSGMLTATGRVGSGSRSGAQVLLGVFIVANVLFLFIMNWFEFFKDLNWVMDMDMPAAKLLSQLTLDLPTKTDSHAAGLYRVASRYAEVTGLNQSWCLFAPDVYDSGTFAELEIRWDDAPPGAPARPGAQERVLLANANAPAALESFFRLGYSRLRKYETNIVVHVRRQEGESAGATLKSWSETIRRRFGKQWDTMQAYINWRRRQWQAEHPGAPPPRQIILYSRCYWIPLPDTEPWAWEGPYTTPAARWRSGDQYVEMYDPISRSFIGRDQALASK